MTAAVDLFVDVFGKAGLHTRLAVGDSALPYNVAKEVESVLEIDGNVRS